MQKQGGYSRNSVITNYWTWRIALIKFLVGLTRGFHGVRNARPNGRPVRWAETQDCCWKRLCAWPQGCIFVRRWEAHLGRSDSSDVDAERKFSYLLYTPRSIFLLFTIQLEYHLKLNWGLNRVGERGGVGLKLLRFDAEVGRPITVFSSQNTVLSCHGWVQMGNGERSISDALNALNREFDLLKIAAGSIWWEGAIFHDCEEDVLVIRSNHVGLRYVVDMELASRSKGAS